MLTNINFTNIIIFMYDIFFVSSYRTDYFSEIKTKFPLVKHVRSFREAQDKALTEFFWIVWGDVVVNSNFDFSYIPDEWSKDYVHVFLDNTLFDCIVLCPTHVEISDKEIEHRFFIKKKLVNVEAGKPKPYDVFEIDSYDEYLKALETSTTEMFWMSSRNITAQIPDIYFDYSNSYDKKINHVFVHQVDDRKLYNGLFLCSKDTVLTEREVNYRHPVSRKEWDIVGSTKKTYDVFEINSYEDYLLALNTSSTEMFWGKLRPMDITDPSVFNLYFDHSNEYDRKQNHAFLHDINGETKYDGLYLFSKHTKVSKKEIDFRHVVYRKEWDIIVSKPKPYDVFEIDSYDEYLKALETSTTEMFWMSSRNITAQIPDIYFDERDDSCLYERHENHVFVNQVDDRKLYNGLFLCSKYKTLSEKEVEFRHLVSRKEWDIVGSTKKTYDVFEINSYEEYLELLKTATTEMFWIVPDYIRVSKQFKFDTYFSHDQTYERTINHVFLNGKYYDGVVLCSKKSKFSRREFDYRFISHKKEWPAIISTPKPYDIVFISYQESNADSNYNRLLTRYSTAKRIHGIKGIHQAHIAAAKTCNTDMFWIVDGDAVLVDDFDFDYQVARWDKETVHVWRSQNPVNGLVYGYGGVKLFPRQMTLDMDVSKPDMTTSISSKFKAVHEISNITAFNSDPLSTWRSAFRECAKLSSKVIDRQKDDETQRRLSIWCTVGADQPYGNYAIDGARSGSVYGTTHQHNKEKLAMINNFEWLEEQFNARNL